MGSLAGTAEEQDWVVYAKPPFGGPERVLKYLARYTHRVAISNQRLVGVEDGKVAFRWKDYSQGNRQRIMTLEGREFLRRFLQHVLRRGFVRIRYYGFLSNRHRAQNLQRVRDLLSHWRPRKTRFLGGTTGGCNTTGMVESSLS